MRIQLHCSVNLFRKLLKLNFIWLLLRGLNWVLFGPHIKAGNTLAVQSAKQFVCACTQKCSLLPAHASRQHFAKTKQLLPKRRLLSFSPSLPLSFSWLAELFMCVCVCLFNMYACKWRMHMSWAELLRVAERVLLLFFTVVRLSFANYALPAVFFMTTPFLWLTAFALSAAAGEFVKNICVILLKSEICRHLTETTRDWLMIDEQRSSWSEYNDWVSMCSV